MVAFYEIEHGIEALEDPPKDMRAAIAARVREAREEMLLGHREVIDG
jgi:hypothetical protein